MTKKRSQEGVTEDAPQFLSPLDRFRRDNCNHCTDVKPTANGRCLLCFLARFIEVLDDLPTAIATELSELKMEQKVAE